MCLPATPNHIADAVAHVRAAANAAGLEQTQRLKVELVIEELFTNTATHGRAARQEAGPAAGAGSVWLQANAVDAGLEVIYEDDGAPFDPTDIAPGMAEERVGGWHIGGLGRALVLFLPNHIRYERAAERNRLVMTFSALPVAEAPKTSRN